MKGNCQMIYGIVDAGGTSMIEKLANTIVVQMIERDYCTSDMKEHYVYALIITVEKWITLATIFGISLMARKVISTILAMLYGNCVYICSNCFIPNILGETYRVVVRSNLCMCHSDWIYWNS